MGRAFTWFPSLTEALSFLPEDEQGAFVLAIVRYGTYGEEPEFEGKDRAIWTMVKETIDNSLNSRTKNRGGRPRKSAEPENPENRPKPENPGCETENPGFDVENPGFAEVKPLPNLTKPNLTKPKERKEKARRFAPPSVEEVRDFIAEKGYHFSADAFMAFYESNGWRVGRNPMKSWQAACATWERRHNEGGFAPDRASPPGNTPIDTDAAARRLLGVA